jgi:mannose-binding lectin 1
MSFDHQNDGATQQFAGCLRDYRNKPFPVKAKLEYYKNTITLLFHSGMTSNDQDYEVCFRADNIHLPSSGYFGISAATGGLADDHDVLAFLVSSIQTPEQYMQASQQAISESEKERLAKEFDEYKQRLDKQKEDYRRENPELARQKEIEEKPEEWFETDAQRELQQIFLGQGKIFDVLRELDRKMIEIIGRQERALSILSAVHVGAAAGQQVPVGSGQAALPGVDTIRRHEVDMVLNNQREITGLSKDIKAFVQDIHQRSGGTGQPTGQGTVTAGVGPDVQNLLNEVREGINRVQRDISNVAAKGTVGGISGDCPSVNCVSTSVFIVFLVIQIIILLGYSVYKDKKETQAKKFY